MKRLKTYKLFEKNKQNEIESVCELLREIEKSYKELINVCKYKQNYIDVDDIIYNSNYPFNQKIDEYEISFWVDDSISNFKELIYEKVYDYLMTPLIVDVDDYEYILSPRDFMNKLKNNVERFCDLNKKLSWKWSDIDELDLNDYLSDSFPYNKSYDDINFTEWYHTTKNLLEIIFYSNITIPIDLFYNEHTIIKKYLKNTEKLEKFEFQKNLFEKYKEDKDFIRWFFDYIKPNKELLELYQLDDLDTYYNMNDIGLF